LRNVASSNKGNHNRHPGVMSDINDLDLENTDLVYTEVAFPVSLQWK